jgi:hypothetical protein
MMEELIVQALLHILEEGLTKLDLWWDRTFGHSLSGRMNKLEIQTLFHGNTAEIGQARSGSQPNSGVLPCYRECEM